jgi:hypothetical protein
MADKNRSQERNLGQNRGQEQQQDRGMNQGRENVGNIQSPQTGRTSSDLEQQRGNQQKGKTSEGGMGYGRSSESGSERFGEESQSSRGSSL